MVHKNKYGSYRMEDNKKVAGIYIRVSTLQQVDRDSLRTQEERLKAYCNFKGIEKYEIYRDAGVSAKDTNRPQFERLNRDIKKKRINYVIVTKLDRITRSLRDLFDITDFFQEHEVIFIAADQDINTESPTGRFSYYLFGLLAQLERETTSERVGIDMRHRAKKGKWNGGIVPYGYTTQDYLGKTLMKKGIKEREALLRAAKKCPEPKKLYIDPSEAEIITWIYSTFLSVDSIRKTTKLLNDKGIRTRKDEPWSTSTIHRILSNPTYNGKIWYGKRKTSIANGKLVSQNRNSWTIVDGEHAPIINDDIFTEVQKILKKNQGKPTKPGRIYLLSGILKCGLCGGAMSGYTFTRKDNDHSYSYYKCSQHLSKGSVKCRGLSIPALQLEEFVINEIKKISESKTFLSDKKKMIDILKRKIKDEGRLIDTNTMNQRIGELEKRNKTLLDKLEKGLIEDKAFQLRYEKNKSEIGSLEAEKNRIHDSDEGNKSAIIDLESSFDAINSFGSQWDFLDTTGKKMRIKSITKEIRATKERVEIDLYVDVDVDNLSRMDRGS